MTISASGADEDGGTVFADPALLDELVHEEEVQQERAAAGERVSRFLDPRVQRLLRERFVETDDVPLKLDVRSWPEAPGFPHQEVRALDGASIVPANRLRQLRFADGRTIYEAWTPVPKKVETDEEFRAASQGRLPIGSWRITYHLFDPHWCDCPTARHERVVHEDGSTHLIHPECGRERKSRVEGPMDEHVLSLQLAPEDDATYNGSYPTLPGDDVVHYTEGKKGMEGHRGDPIKRANPLVINGKLVEPYLRGGSYIKGGRAEHRRRTKDMIHLGPGYLKDIAKVEAEKEAKKKAAMRIKLEKTLQLAPRKPFEV